MGSWHYVAASRDSMRRPALDSKRLTVLFGNTIIACLHGFDAGGAARRPTAMSIDGQSVARLAGCECAALYRRGVSTHRTVTAKNTRKPEMVVSAVILNRSRSTRCICKRRQCAALTRSDERPINCARF